MLKPEDIYLVERLARGGMAEVFLAIAELDGRSSWVVVKRVLPEHAEHAVYRTLFEQEQAVVGKVNHPNVVRAFPSHTGEITALVMEYIHGTSLFELLIHAKEQDVNIPVPVAAYLLFQACQGAHAAHELRDDNGQLLDVIHRDLTPHNLMVSLSGKLSIIDFGIATTTTTRTLQHQRSVQGKTRYLSPECIQQRLQDRRTDVFTLGVVGYELLTGERYANDETDEAQDLRSELHRTDVPDGMVDALARAMAPSAERRWPTAHAFSEALTPFFDMRQAQREASALVQRLTGDVLQARKKRYQALQAAHRIPFPLLTGRTWEETEVSVRGQAIRTRRARHQTRRFLVAFATTVVALCVSALYTPQTALHEDDLASRPYTIATERNQALPLRLDASPYLKWSSTPLDLERGLEAYDESFDALLVAGDRPPIDGWLVAAYAEIHGQTRRLEQLVTPAKPRAQPHPTSSTLCFAGTENALDRAKALYRNTRGASSSAPLHAEQLASPLQVLQNTARGACAAGIVPGTALATAPLHGIVTGSVRVVGTTRFQPTPTLLVRKEMSPERRDAFLSTVTGLETTVHGSQGLDEAITGFRAAPDLLGGRR